jgi:hypothetical protein
MGSPRNLKVTRPEDLPIAEALAREQDLRHARHQNRHSNEQC